MADVRTMTDGIQGTWDDRFQPLVELFAGSIADGCERGHIALAMEGQLVVDAWGGLADPHTGRGWAADTLACCFSVTKAVLALLAHRLVDAGQLDLARPVADYWPEFAAAGKSAITVLDVLTHRAGLPAVSVPVRSGSLYDWQAMTAMLAASAPVVPARSHPVYHNMTFGHLLGEVMLRATGAASLTALLGHSLTGPLDVDFALGLTPTQAARTAHITQESGRPALEGLDPASEALFQRSMRFFAPDEDFNTAAWRSASIGSGGGHTTARALAMLMGQLVWHDALLSPQRQQAARTLHASSNGPDPILGLAMRYGQGIELSTPPGLDFGPHPSTPGHWGAGGSIAFADPDRQLSFGYVTGLMAAGAGSSDRSRRLVQALYACL
jgi:CubicO group peptidase (beta-lactamase class C family)